MSPAYIQYIYIYIYTHTHTYIYIKWPEHNFSLSLPEHYTKAVDKIKIKKGRRRRRRRKRKEILKKHQKTPRFKPVFHNRVIF